VGAILLMKSELDLGRDLAHMHPIHLPAQEKQTLLLRAGVAAPPVPLEVHSSATALP